MWTPDWYRDKVRAAVPLLQQTSDEKLPVSQLKDRGISTLTLHYSQARAQDIRYTHIITQSSFSLKVKHLYIVVLNAVFVWTGSFPAVMWVWMCIQWTSRGFIHSCGAAECSRFPPTLRTSWRKCLILSGSWYYFLKYWFVNHARLYSNMRQKQNVGHLHLCDLQYDVIYSTDNMQIICLLVLFHCLAHTVICPSSGWVLLWHLLLFRRVQMNIAWYGSPRISSL